MGSWQHLNEFIGERLTAAAVEIFGAVEKTLSEFQGEISRSKREIEHLRALVSRPEVKLHRSGMLMKYVIKTTNSYLSQHMQNMVY